MGVVGPPFFVGNVPNTPLALSAAVRSSKRGVKTQFKQLHPFTHVASIPADVDAGNIRFEKVKSTRVFTMEKFIADSGYCDNVQFNEPGGSMYCPFTEDVSPAPAYEVTYSFKGEPLASDEYGNRYFTFAVYFRPEEFPSALRRALSAKVNRAELATYFKVTTSRQTVQASVIDKAHSSLCGGNQVDGNWIQNDPHCKDKVSFMTVTKPSDYITVQVDPVSPRPQQAAAPEKKDHSLVLYARTKRR